MQAVYIVISLALLGGGIVSLLVGMGRVTPPQRFANLKGSDDIAMIGRVLIFLGLLLSPTLLGYTPSDIGALLREIWSAGGGVGTG